MNFQNLRYDFQNDLMNIIILISGMILFQIAVAYMTWVVFQSYIDYYDYLYHYTHLTIPLFEQGLLPYINYDWEYPVLLMIPELFGGALAYITNNFYVLIIFTIWFMAVCNAITIICIYLISMEIYGDKKKAFLSGVLYATALSIAYFSICRFDPFPMTLLMLGLLFTIRNCNASGYIMVVLGFFTKIFPIVALPFLIIYNGKWWTYTKEFLVALCIFVAGFLVFVVPIYLANPDSISVYFLRTEMSKQIFVSTLAHTIHALTGLPLEPLAFAMYAAAGIVILLMLWHLFSTKTRDPILLLKCVMVAIVAIVVGSKYHSPQYLMWFVPVCCILIVGEIQATMLFVLFQIIEYIKFPLMYANRFDNTRYMAAYHTQDWWTTLLFFVVEFVTLFALVLATLKVRNKYTPELDE